MNIAKNKVASMAIALVAFATVGQTAWADTFTTDANKIVTGYFGAGGDIVLPDGATGVADTVFAGKAAITSVTFPASVTSIGEEAFQDCSGITNIIFMGDAPVLGDYAFENVAAGCTVYVQRGSTGWGVEIPGTWVAGECSLPIKYADSAPHRFSSWQTSWRTRFRSIWTKPTCLNTSTSTRGIRTGIRCATSVHTLRSPSSTRCYRRFIHKGHKEFRIFRG